MSQENLNTEDQKQIPLVDTIVAYLKEEQYDDIESQLAPLHASEIAILLESLPKKLRRELWGVLPVDVEGEILTYLDEEIRSSIFDVMESAEVVAATENLDTEDIADLIDELPADVGEAVLQSMDEDRRHRLEVSLSFEEGTAGRIMSTDVISVRKDVTIAVVLRYLRFVKPLPANFDAIMVTDEEGIYLGKLILADALSEHPSTIVADVMLEMADVIHTNASEHDIANMFNRRDLISAAVVNDDNVLLGRIGVDDAVAIMKAEADKALLASAGLDENEGLFAPVIQSAKRRAVWLGINLATVFLAAWVIGRFEEVLDKIVALAVLLPVVASMGGIAGSQTLTLTIRGLALNQVSASNLRWLSNKELAIGLLNGVAWSVVVAVVTYFWFSDTGIASIIAAAMLINLFAAALSGVMIPVILDRMDIDPALSGAVVLTTVTDIVGFLSFLGLATIFLL